MDHLAESSLQVAKSSELAYRAQRAFVALMFDVLGRLLCSASETDPVLREELRGFSEGYRLGFAILGDPLAMRLRVESGRFVLAREQVRCDLTITFKHLTHCYTLLRFIESTPRAYASGRFVIDGDIAASMRFVRCVDRVQAVMLPEFVAARALKEVPEIPTGERLKIAVGVTGRFVQSYLRRAS